MKARPTMGCFGYILLPPVARSVHETFNVSVLVYHRRYERYCAIEGVAMATMSESREVRPSVEHPVAIVLGSGLGQLSGLVKPVRRIPYKEIPGFPQSAQPVSGHVFEATVGTVGGVPVVVYPGRVHLYQGYDAWGVTSVVRHAHRLGCRTIVFACATGAIPGKAEVGLGLITDHINLTGTNPLVGWSEDASAGDGTSYEFVSMNEVYSQRLRGIARKAAEDERIALSEGVLAGVLGPSFETPAEVRALGALGATYVGFSVVLEAIQAHALGMSVLGLTLASNLAGAAGVSHQTVLDVAGNYAPQFERLVCRTLRNLM